MSSVRTLTIYFREAFFSRNLGVIFLALIDQVICEHSELYESFLVLVYQFFRDLDIARESSRQDCFSLPV